MRAVEIDRGDPGRIGGKVGEHVAAAGRDRDEMIARAQCQRLHVDRRVFPDLRIDEAAERQREQPLEGTGSRQRAGPVDGAIETLDGGASYRLRRPGHAASIPLEVRLSPLAAIGDGGMTRRHSDKAVGGYQSSSQTRLSMKRLTP